MNPYLNETLESSFIKRNWSNKKFQEIIRLIATRHGLDINRIDDNSFAKMDAAAAAKLNKKELYKFWIWNGKIEVATHSNSLYDEYLETNRRRMNQRRIAITNMPFTYGRGDTPAQWRNFLATANECWVLNLNSAATLKDIRSIRKKAKEGAIALMSNREIKRMNIENFKAKAKKLRFSDGSETDLINNITKYFDTILRKVTPGQLILRMLNDTWASTYAIKYSEKLLEYFEYLNENGFLIPDLTLSDIMDMDKNERKEFDYDLASYRKNLEDSVDAFKKNITNQFAGKDINYFNIGLKELLSKDSIFMSAYATIDNGKYLKQVEDVIEVYKIVNSYGTEALKNKNISNDLLSFDAFWVQLDGLSRLLKTDFGYLVNGIGEIGYTISDFKPKTVEDVIPLIKERGLDFKYIRNMTVFKGRIEKVMQSISRI